LFWTGYSNKIIYYQTGIGSMSKNGL